MDLVELSGKVFSPATCLGKSLFAYVLHLVVSESDNCCNALVGAVLPWVDGWILCMKPQQ